MITFKKTVFGLLSLLLAFVATAGTQPKFNIVAQTSATMNIPNTGSGFVNYTVTNETALTRTLTMVPIPGLTQDTTAGFCPNPFTLAPGASCTLHLVMNGATAPTHITGGPQICKTMGPGNNAPDPFLCSTACGSNQLNLQVVFLLSIVVSPVNPTIRIGETQQFMATGYYSDGSSQNLTTAATWASSNILVGTISNLSGSKGLALGLTPGVTTISATVANITGQTTLTVVGFFAYVANFSTDTVSKCTINLSAAVSTCSDSGQGTVFAPNPEFIAINPSKTIAYVSTTPSSTLRRCPIDPITGDFLPCDSPEPAPYGIDNSLGLTLDPTGTYIYITNFSPLETITQCPVSDFNNCTNACALNSCNTISNPYDISITPDGRFAYIVNAPSVNPSVTVCKVNAVTGALDPCSDSGAGTFSQPRGMAISPSGVFAYITDIGNNTITVCTINSITGSLNSCTNANATLLSNPFDLALNATGNFAYITNVLTNSITQCVVNTTSGLMSSCINNGPTAPLSFPIGIALG